MNLDKRLEKLEEGMAKVIRMLKRLEKGGVTGGGGTIDTTPSNKVEDDSKYTVRELSVIVVHNMHACSTMESTCSHCLERTIYSVWTTDFEPSLY